MTYKILVCGGRDYKDNDKIYSVLYDIMQKIHEDTDIKIISGGARGVDTVAIDFAVYYGLYYQEYYADWKTHGRRAGPIRNIQMLEEGKPDLVVAFPGSRGTAHMVKIAKAKGVEVIEVE